ncbi:ester cyclase [Streptomyces sp. NPDC051243]|uniref:nuclear transport factor 2 family protein n=1 Tax=Streptomyces sp. NPDC051243 TaxID=3365646 RepID=UPI003794ADC3
MQHTPRIADGLEGFREFVETLKADFPYLRAEVKRIFAEGDHVIAHVHGVRVPGGPETAIVDIFRLEDGRIAEHWDLRQQIPDEARNHNGMFRQHTGPGRVIMRHPGPRRAPARPAGCPGRGACAQWGEATVVFVVRSASRPCRPCWCRAAAAGGGRCELRSRAWSAGPAVGRLVTERDPWPGDGLLRASAVSREP